MWKLFWSMLKFGMVGLVGMAIDFGLTWICKEKLRINKYVANGVGFSFAVVNNYFLNRIWTFSNKNPQILNQFMQFLLVSLVGLSLNTLVLYLVHKKLNVKFYFSKLIAIGIVFIWNYFANLYFTFQ